jgi:hypothetical protein
LEFPRFDGSEASEWILRAQQSFDYYLTLEHQRVQLASFQMEGKALTWYQWLRDSEALGTWAEFIDALKVRFTLSAYDDPIGAFTKLKQTNTVKEYQSQFEVLSNCIAGLSEEFRVRNFLSGLKEEIRITVVMLMPTTLTLAFGLARLQEEEVTRRSRNYRNPQPLNSSPYIANRNTYPRLATTTPLPRLSTPIPYQEPKPVNNPNSNNHFRRSNFPIRRISPTQMQERRERGLCYYCDDKYMPGHQCNRPKIFLLEGFNSEEEDAAQGEEALVVDPLVEEPESSQGEGELLRISLHAIASSPAPKTMRMMGRLNNQFVVVLIDTGSTNNFVDPDVARKEKLPIQESTTLTVIVANGATIP